jgi:hypothetical protein
MLPQLIDPERRLMIAKHHADELRMEWRIANAVNNRPCSPSASGNVRESARRALARLGPRLLAAPAPPSRSTGPAHPADSGC